MICVECKQEFINTYEYIEINYIDNRNNSYAKHYHIACFMDKLKDVTSTEIQLDNYTTLTIDRSGRIDDFFEYEVLEKPRPKQHRQGFPC